jgi:hypothetical protein
MDRVNDFIRLINTKLYTPPIYTVICPVHAVVLSGRSIGEHEPIVAKYGWIVANVKLIGELGTGEWLWRLPNVLKTGGV